MPENVGIQEEMQPLRPQPTRRDFLRGMGVAAGALGTLGAFGCSPGTDDTDKNANAQQDVDEDIPTSLTEDYVSTGDDKTYLPQFDEHAVPVMPAPETTSYNSDVLVVGGGLAGLHAAYAAAQAGKSVVLVDKGTPGYSGLSAWPSCTAYYDPDLDADLETWDEYMRLSCYNFANLNWEDVWLKESKETVARLREWGWLSEYPRVEDTEFFVDGIMFHDDVKGYFRSVPDRRQVFMKVLEENNVTVVPATMIVDIVEQDGQCVGAVGLHFKSGTIISFTAKSTVLCTGNGVTKSSGYPLGADTYDGVWFGYQHGLPISGLEFEDFHMTASFAPGNVLMVNDWPYIENVWLTGGTVDADHMIKKAGVDGRVSSFLDGFKRSSHDTTFMNGAEEGAACSSAVLNGNTEDPRKGKWTSPMPKGDVYGAAPGMSVHTAAGIWCGIDDTDGETGLPGLYVAGDGTCSSYAGGPNYGCQRGSTSSFFAIQGMHAGGAAAKYSDGVASVSLPTDKVAALEEQTLAPLTVETGYDANWARDVLHGIMSPGWIIIAKDEGSLSSALNRVQGLRKLVSGKMMAMNPHDLRLIQEVEHQLLACELKLRVGLERKESRGYHYRTDYPFSDDNYLYYITMTKGADGSPVFGKVDLPDRWKGDLSADYLTRYPNKNYPEEVEKYGK